MPPPFDELRALPSLPPDRIRQLRREGMIDKDWTSRLRVKGGEDFMPLVHLTREPVVAAEQNKLDL